MDPETIRVVATAAVGFLSPYLAKTGEAAAKKIGEDIYQALKARFGWRPAAQEALADLERTPGDTDFQAALRVQLKKLLGREDEEFAAQLHHLLQEAERTEAGGVIIQQVAGDNAQQFGQVFGGVNINQD